MRTSLRTSTLVLAILGSISFAAAQSTPGDMQQEKLNLSQSKERQVTQGLSREQSQSAAGYQGQVGSKPPASLSAKPMPDDVADRRASCNSRSDSSPRRNLTNSALAVSSV